MLAVLRELRPLRDVLATESPQRLGRRLPVKAISRRHREFPMLICVGQGARKRAAMGERLPRCCSTQHHYLYPSCLHCWHRVRPFS